MILRLGNMDKRMEDQTERELQLDLLWLAYLSGQYGKETLEWHKRNTTGFAEHVALRLASIWGEEAWQGEGAQHGKT